MPWSLSQRQQSGNASLFVVYTELLRVAVGYEEERLLLHLQKIRCGNLNWPGCTEGNHGKSCFRYYLLYTSVMTTVIGNLMKFVCWLVGWSTFSFVHAYFLPKNLSLSVLLGLNNIDFCKEETGCTTWFGTAAWCQKYHAANCFGVKSLARFGYELHSLSVSTCMCFLIFLGLW